MSILSHAVQSYSDFDDPQYPIVRLHKYRATRSMDGVAAGRPLEIRYALVLRAEFVSVGKTEGPYRDLYFKILPKGSCSISGCLVGFPVLDVRPYGLGHTTQFTTHCFEELGAALPRLELDRRGEHFASLTTYLESDGERCASFHEGPGASQRRTLPPLARNGSRH